METQVRTFFILLTNSFYKSQINYKTLYKCYSIQMSNYLFLLLGGRMQRRQMRTRQRQMQRRRRHGGRRHLRLQRHQQLRRAAPPTPNGLRLQRRLRRRPLRDHLERVRPRTLPDLHEVHARFVHRRLQLPLPGRSDGPSLQRQRDQLCQPEVRRSQPDVVFREKLRAVHHQEVAGEAPEREHVAEDASPDGHGHVCSRRCRLQRFGTCQRSYQVSTYKLLNT